MKMMGMMTSPLIITISEKEKYIMSQVIIERGGRFVMGDDSTTITHKVLPAGVYKIGMSQNGPFLYSAPDFIMSGKMYGNVEKRVDRIMKTFETRPFTTGVLLSGDKGSGKTMLAKRIAQTAVKEGFPVVIVNPELANAGSFIVEYLTSFDFPMVIIMDEFEKMFEETEHQNSLLTMFDGLYSVKRLFLLTVNNLGRVNDFFKSRPGRIFYHYQYHGLDSQVVREYCEDFNLDADFLSELLIYHQLNDDLTFDSLKAIVEESKRYGMNFEDTIEGMNISMFRTNENFQHWSVKLVMPFINETVIINEKHKGSFANMLIRWDEDIHKFARGNKAKFNKWYPDHGHVTYFRLPKGNFIEKTEDGFKFAISDIDPEDAYVLIKEYQYNHDQDKTGKSEYMDV